MIQRTTVIWGTAETRRMLHAFVERPGFSWRSNRPRALCGKAWSPDRTPQPADGLPRCKDCARITAAKGEEADQ